MAAYVLKRQWHTESFFRTITVRGKSERLKFTKREPTELSAEQFAALEATGGAPIEAPKAARVAVAKPDKPKKGK